MISGESSEQVLRFIRFILSADNSMHVEIVAYWKIIVLTAVEDLCEAAPITLRSSLRL